MTLRDGASGFALLLGILSIGLLQPTHAQLVLTDSTFMSRHENSSTLPVGSTDTTSLSFKDTDLRDIFRAISLQHGVNVFLDNAINKKVTVSLNRVRVYDAITFLAAQNKLVVLLEGGIFRITQPPPPAPPPDPPPRIPGVLFENGLLSVDLKSDDLEKVVLLIQERCSKNILVISGTSGTVSGKLIDIEFDLGFTQLMNNNGFAVQKKNSIYIVSRQEYFVGAQGTSTPQKSGPYWVSVKDSLVSIDVTNAPLERLLHDMTRQLSADIVFYSTINGTVSARATNVPLSRALDIILRNTNYAYKEAEGIGLRRREDEQEPHHDTASPAQVPYSRPRRGTPPAVDHLTRCREGDQGTKRPRRGRLGRCGGAGEGVPRTTGPARRPGTHRSDRDRLRCLAWL